MATRLPSIKVPPSRSHGDRAADTNTATSRPLQTIDSRSPSSPDTAPQSSRSPASAEGPSFPTTNTTNTTATPSKKITSRLSRSNTASASKDQGREKRSDSYNGKPEDVAKHTLDSPPLQATPQAAPARHSSTPPPASAIDPLSQHIFMRTNTDHSIPPRLRNPARPESPSAVDGLARPSSDLSGKLPTPTGDAGKEKRKGASFLSRLSMRSSRRKDNPEIDTDSELGSEARPDGADARVFSQAVGVAGGGGYIPRHKEPPRYIRTKAVNKKVKEFNRLFLAQELVGTRPPQDGAETSGKTPVVTVSSAGGAGTRRATRTGGAIWATEFSKDGKYLAAAGRDQVVRVWAVISTHEERRMHEEDQELANGGAGERLNAPVFLEKPVREFTGHKGEVLDLSWSKNNFLLSSSMDKTVRLWHMSRNECLCTFKHKDFVTKLAFHPRDDRFFLAGSLDTMLRLWSIPDKAIAYSVQLPDLVTAVSFSPDGKTAIAGVLNGLCLFYETEGLKWQSQIHVRSSRGKNAKGSKITGIQTMAIAPLPARTAASATTTPLSATFPAPPRTSTELASASDVKVLITSNDSRVRVYNMRDKSLDVKFKGHENAYSQIAATFSDDGAYVICGSEDRKAFIWNMNTVTADADKDKRPCEWFDAHSDMVTTALFAPTRTRMLLGGSGDPIYDLCNPPPVTLRSLEEAANASLSGVSLEDEAHVKKTEESPAYVARSMHYDGNIIITSDDTGIIKVFRQDCAFAKRKHDSWETGSTFSRKMGGPPGSGLMPAIGRSGSILTRTSASSAAHSRRGSLSHVANHAAVGSPQLGAVTSDRILSWRQGIEGNGDRRSSATIGGQVGNGQGWGTPVRSERSLSPNKASRTPMGASAANLASEARKQPYVGSSPQVSRPTGVMSPTSSVFSSSTVEKTPIKSDRDIKKVKSKEQPADPSAPPVPSFSFRAADDEEDNLRLDPAGASYSFWNLSRWRGITGLRNSINSQGATSAKAVSEASTPAKAAGGKEDEAPPSDGENDIELSVNKEKEKASRRKSVGVGWASKSAGAPPGEDKASRRQSMPPGILQQAINNVSNLLPTILTTDEDKDKELLADEGNHLSADPDRNRAARLSRGTSFVSKLSSELSSPDEAEDSGEEMRCRKCGGREFKARRVNGRQRLSCGRCGMLVDENGGPS